MSSTHANPHSRRSALVELCITYGLILVVIWSPRPEQKIFWGFAATAVVVCTIRSFDGTAAMGLRKAGFLRSLWVVGVALALCGLAVFIALHVNTLRMPPGGAWGFIRNYWAYALFALAQQFLLQSFFLLRLLKRIKNEWLAALAATLLFAIAHLPNPILTAMTLLWGGAACLLFLRYRNLYALAVAHALFGITLSMTVPGPVDHNMRVGLSYLHYHTRRVRPLAQP
jgi:membrane protease YdiL (CAAX protease family)